MKKIIMALVFALCTLTPCFAQQGVQSNKFTIAGPGTVINLVNTTIAFHQLKWSVSGTASVCTVALDTSTNGTTWTAGGAIAGQNCTVNGSSSVANITANYVRINTTALTLTAGSSVTVTWDGYTSSPSGGGSITSCNIIGGVLYQNGTLNTATCSAAFFYNPTSSWNAGSTSGTDNIRMQFDFSGGAGHPVWNIQASVAGLGAQFSLAADTSLATFGGANQPSTQIDASTKGTGFPVAASGIYRLSKAGTDCWRNNANSGDNCIAVNAADQPTFNGTLIAPAGTAFAVLAETGSFGNNLLGPAQNATSLSSFYLITPVSVLNRITYRVGSLGDNSANLYDIGVYGPGCLNGTTNVPLVFHTGAQAGSVLFPALNTIMNVAISGAPVTVNMTPGWYCAALTTNQSIAPARLSGELTAFHDLQFAASSSPGGSTGTTSGGALNSTITAPVAGWVSGAGIFLSGF